MSEQHRVRTFRDLIVWKQGMALCLAIYEASASFPVDERFGLVQELRKTARSIVYNIAEGHRRSSTLEFLRFLDIARGSAAELDTQLLLADSLHYTTPVTTHALRCDLSAIDRMLATLVTRLQRKVTNEQRP